MRNIILLFSVWLAIFSTAAQATQDLAGTISNMSGVLVAQRTDGTIKVLSRNSEVFAGDMLITSKNSYAQVKMKDGSQMTLRPNSNLRIEAFKFNKDAPQADNMVLRLLKGGFRAFTGLIGKRGNADAYKLRAASATIGIRGTDFSSRLCFLKDCKDDEDETRPAEAKIKTQAVQSKVVGRVMLAQGSFSAKNESGKERKLVLGGPVYEGDTLITGVKSNAVVAFRDESRVSFQPNTQFHVEKFKYDKARTEENAVLRLLRGGVRVFTGLIGRVNHNNYQFKVASATIGIRGTGFDAWCNGPCASGSDNPGATQNNPLDGAGVYVWSGEVVLVSPGGSFTVALQQAAIIARDSGKPVRIIAIPPDIIDNNSAPRPDGVPVDMEKLFGGESNDGEPGLYVTVHDGNVIVTQGQESLDLGIGETGFASGEVLFRLANLPEFVSGNIQIDPNGSNPAMNPNGCTIAP